MASIGPKNVALTAELAEGWMPAFSIPEQAHDVFGEALAAGHANLIPGSVRWTSSPVASSRWATT